MNNTSVADTSALHLELTDVNKYRLDEINRIKEFFLSMKLKKEKI